jgi:hypothetical protein
MVSFLKFRSSRVKPGMTAKVFSVCKKIYSKDTLKNGTSRQTGKIIIPCSVYYHHNY